MQEITQLIKFFLKDLKNIILDTEVDYLANRCAGMTGDDIKKMIYKASYDCMEKVRKSHYFVQNPQNPFLCLKDTCQAWHPCPRVFFGCGAKEQDPMNKNVAFCIPPITAFDLLAAVEVTGKTVKPETLREHVDFAENNGVEVDEPHAAAKEKNSKTLQFCSNCQCDRCEMIRQ